VSALATPARERTPDRPGPGPIPDASLKALDLVLGRRIDGMIAGDHLAHALGGGRELAQIRPYVPGDDVRRIDWNATARTGEPHVRVDVAERALTTWLLLDASPSMTFGTADRRKWDVAEGAALVVGHLATRRGNRLGLVTYGEERQRFVPPRQGRAGLLGTLGALRQEPAHAGGGATSPSAALLRAGAMARSRSLIVLVGDLRGLRDWRGPLLALAARHSVLAVEVRDPREQELPDVGHLWLVDPETGRQLQVDTRSRTLRERFREAAAGERDEVAAELRRAGVGHVVVSTAGDWFRTLATGLERAAGHGVRR
jgi:uncharacterized protein (DUF58 family)